MLSDSHAQTLAQEIRENLKEIVSKMELLQKSGYDTYLMGEDRAGHYPLYIRTLKDRELVVSKTIRL